MTMQPQTVVARFEGAIRPVGDVKASDSHTGRKVLCVIAAGLFEPTGTFVRQHVEGIAPGRTIVVTFDRSPGADWDLPAISLPFPHLNGAGKLRRKIRSVWNVLRHGCSMPLRSKDLGRLTSFFREHNAGVVLAEYGPTACVVREACDRCEIPLYAHFHGYDISRLLSRWKTRFEYRKMAQSASGLICPSRFTANRLLQIGIPESKVFVNPYGVDVRRFAPSEARKQKNIIAVGRFVEKKAPQHTISAFAFVARNQKDLTLEMIGDGPLLPECRKLAGRLGLHDRIIFHGAQKQEVIARRMAGALLFLQHSVTAADGDTEGLPVAILEAMSCGLPVVATRHSGIPEAVVEGETGLLVDEHDVEGMAAAIMKLVCSEQLRCSMGVAARNRVLENFSTPMQMARLRRLMSL